MPLNPTLKRLINIAYRNDFANLHNFPVEKMRSYLTHSKIRTPKAPFCDITVNPKVKLRCYTPAKATENEILPGIVFISASAFIIDRLDASNHYCSLIANESHMKVINISHRLAPEHKFPKFYYDCRDSIQWLAQFGKDYAIDTDKISIWGESSGGTIAASLAHLLKDADKPIIKYQTLIYPLLDILGTYPSKEAYSMGYMLDKTFMKWLEERALEPDHDPSHPLTSPIRHTDFHHLPATTLFTAQYDPLRDEGELYVKKLKAANIPVYHKRYPGMIHGFMRFFNNIEEPKEAMSLACTQLQAFFNHQPEKVMSEDL